MFQDVAEKPHKASSNVPASSIGARLQVQVGNFPFAASEGLQSKFPVKKNNGRTWLFLINGGEKSFAEENVARDELKKIYHCFVSNKLVKPEHVVCASGGKGKLFQHETITNVSKVSSVVPQNTTYKQADRPADKPVDKPVDRPLLATPKMKATGKSSVPKGAPSLHVLPNTSLALDDSAIVVFIGHGSDPLSASLMPPSIDQSTGRLIFLSREPKQSQSNNMSGSLGFETSFPAQPNFVHGGFGTPLATPSSPDTNGNKRYDDLSDFQLAAGKTLFICQACYSGNTVNKMTKRAANPAENKHILAISTGPDHPASYDPILADAISDFFSSDWKQKTLSNFHEHIQKRYYDFPYYKQMLKENLDQTEEDYEEERCDATEWATGEFEMHQPRKIPQELWKMFQAVESLKASINHSDQNKEQLMAHVREMERYRFGLMRMYKHKPSYKMHMYGNIDVMGKLKMAEFLNLSQS